MKICASCHKEISSTDAVRYGYGGPSHDSSRCISLLQLEIEKLKHELEIYKSELKFQRQRSDIAMEERDYLQKKLEQLNG